MTYYDKSGRRVPAPRHDVVPSNVATVALVIVAIVLIIGAGVWAWLGQREVVEVSEAAARRERITKLVCQDSMSEIITDDGHRIRLYVTPDVDTGKELVVAYSDDGGVGVCPRPEGDIEYE